MHCHLAPIQLIRKKKYYEQYSFYLSILLSHQRVVGITWYHTIRFLNALPTIISRYSHSDINFHHICENVVE